MQIKIDKLLKIIKKLKKEITSKLKSAKIKELKLIIPAISLAGNFIIKHIEGKLRCG